MQLGDPVDDLVDAPQEVEVGWSGRGTRLSARRQMASTSVAVDRLRARRRSIRSACRAMASRGGATVQRVDVGPGSRRPQASSSAVPSSTSSSVSPSAIMAGLEGAPSRTAVR